MNPSIHFGQSSDCTPPALVHGPAVSKEKLEESYRKVLPGCFWDVQSTEVCELPGKVLSLSTILDVAGGIMLSYGISLAIGYSILLKFDKAAVCCLLTVIG